MTDWWTLARLPSVFECKNQSVSTDIRRFRSIFFPPFPILLGYSVKFLIITMNICRLLLFLFFFSCPLLAVVAVDWTPVDILFNLWYYESNEKPVNICIWVSGWQSYLVAIWFFSNSIVSVIFWSDKPIRERIFIPNFSKKRVDWCNSKFHSEWIGQRWFGMFVIFF